MLQTQRAECGLACLAMIANAHGMQTDLHDLRRRFPVSIKGATLRQILNQAAWIGLAGRPLSLSLEEVRELQVPCILHWDMNHFVVLRKVSTKRILILDPAVGERRVTFDEASRRFTGVALELTPDSKFQVESKPRRVQIAQLTGRVLGLKRYILRVFCVALALQLFAIIAPLLNQIVVDDVIASANHELLAVVVVGFGLLLLIQTALGLVRSWMLINLGQTLSLQWAGNVFSHLLRLPIDYFESRSLGDIASRFGAVDAIRRTLTTSVIEAILDGIMAIAALVMMVLYSPTLSIVTLASVCAYGALRWLRYRPLRDAAAERMVLAARSNTHFLESIRAIVPLKLFGREEERRIRWQNLTVDVQNRDTRTARMMAGFGVANTLVFGTENLAIFWLGATWVMESSTVAAGVLSTNFTIGMFLAYIAYKAQFVGRVAALIDYSVELKMLGLHAERLADIAFTEPEGRAAMHDSSTADLHHLPASIELRDVSFRYGEGEPWILRHANLTVNPGESVAITGPSGAGKTTLMKVMLGLLHPQEGEVLYGGRAVQQLGLSNIRNAIGSVMQEDALLTGSLAENICFFDSDPDQARIEDCAAAAQMHAEIIKMPMGYQTLVGDLGSGLSGGQKQRVLLARALYKQPKLLALDEATSHLDVAVEQAVNSALRDQSLTKLIVAHRTETIASARRVVRLRDGALEEINDP